MIMLCKGEISGTENTLPATPEEDAQINVSNCTNMTFGNCYLGYTGTNVCSRCDGTSSQLFVNGGFWFPNTEAGYKEALQTVREINARPPHPRFKK